MNIFAPSLNKPLAAALGLAAVGVLLFLAVQRASTAAPPPGSAQQAGPATLEEAGAVLGRSVPQLHYQMTGLALSGIGIDPPGPIARAVHVSYALNGRNVVLMTLRIGALGMAEGEDFQLPGAVAKALVRPIDGGAQDASYAWSRDGVTFVLHVKLADGTTHAVADQMARSVK